MADRQALARTPFDHGCLDHLSEITVLQRNTRSGQGVASFTTEEFLAADVLSVQFADGPAGWSANRPGRPSCSTCCRTAPSP